MTKNTVEKNFNTIQATIGTVTALGLDKIGKPVLGYIITPAIWTLNYMSKNISPGLIDYSVYGLGFFNGPAGISVGLFKAVMDDDIAAKVDEIRIRQDAKYRSFIFPVQSFNNMQPLMSAMTIASKGGTAWLGHNGQWVYITDANGSQVVDFEPVDAVKVIQPVFPVQTENGLFRYTVCTISCR